MESGCCCHGVLVLVVVAGVTLLLLFRVYGCKGGSSEKGREWVPYIGERGEDEE